MGVTKENSQTVDTRSNTPIDLSEFKAIYLKYKNRYSPGLNKFYKTLNKYRIPEAIVLSLMFIQLSLLLSNIAGLYANTLGFALLLTIALKSPDARKLAIAASILPLLNLASISFTQSSATIQSFIYMDLMMLLAVTYITYFKQDFSISKKWADKGQAVSWYASAIVLAYLVGVICFNLFGNKLLLSGASSLILLITSVFFAGVETMFYRGLVQRLSSVIYGPLSAFIFSLFVWTSMSIIHQFWEGLVYGLVSGILLSALYYFRQNLLLNAVTNIVIKITYVLFATKLIT